jgi:hypothetical protein
MPENQSINDILRMSHGCALECEKPKKIALIAKELTV